MWMTSISLSLVLKKLFAEVVNLLNFLKIGKMMLAETGSVIAHI